MTKSEKYIVGKYDLEVLTIPRIYVKAMDISQNKTTTIQITPPGIVNVLMTGNGYGSLYLEDDNLMKWQYNFEENASRDLIIVQPGNYHIVWRSKGSRETLNTIDKEFKVESGASVTIRLN